DADTRVFGRGEEERARRVVGIFSYYVEQEREVSGEGATFRLLRARRLDTLNWRDNFIGYTSPRAGAALVLLDRIEELLVQSIVPSMAPNEPARLVDTKSLEVEKDCPSAVEARAGEVIRREYPSIPGASAGAVLELGKLLARRRALLVKWRASLSWEARLV